MATRNEVEKLALYVGKGGTASVADVEASVGDSAELSLQDVAFATASGDVPRLLRTLDRAYALGERPVRILRAASIGRARVGTELFRTCRSRGSADHSQKKKHQ